MMDVGKRSFNLLDEPWIPVVGHGEKSVLDVFTDLSYRRLGGNPVEKVTITRLLLAIVHAAVPLPDAAAWRALTVEEIAQKARDYLSRWHDRFDLYDPQRPFLQFPRLRELEGCEVKPIEKLSLLVGSDNGGVLTDWARPEFTPAEIARLVVAGVGYGCSGKKYAYTKHNGKNVCIILTKNSEMQSGTPAPGTLMGGKGYLHAMLVGDTLLDTLRLNLLPDDYLRALKMFPHSCPCGRPFWEKMPKYTDSDDASAYRDSYQGTLFPLDKFLLLADEGVVLTNGIVYAQPHWDPGVTISKDGKKDKTLWTQAERQPWRELPALLRFIDPTSGQTTPAFLIHGFDKKLPKVDKGDIGIWTGGVGVDNKLGEQYVSGDSGFQDSEYSLPIEWVNDSEMTYHWYSIIMEEVNHCSSITGDAIRKYYEEIANDARKKVLASPMKNRGVQLFWEKMEPLADSLLLLAVDMNNVAEASQRDALLGTASKEWLRVAESCYADVCPHATPRQIGVYARCRPRFGAAQPGAAKAKKDKRKKTSLEKKGDQ